MMRRGSAAGRLLVVIAVALVTAAGTAHAALPDWADVDGPLFNDGDSVKAAGSTFVGIDANRHTLRFSAAEGLTFTQWVAPPDEFGERPTIDDFAPTASGAAWVSLKLDDDTYEGFERVGGDTGVLTPLHNPCAEDDLDVSVLGVSADERLWVSCDHGVATIGSDGTVTAVRCDACINADTTASAGTAGMWFVHGSSHGWDLRLVDPSGAVVGARSFRGPTPEEMAAAGDRLYWLRSQTGVTATPAPAIVEGVPVSAWQTAAAVAYRQGLSARVGRGRFPADPNFRSLTPLDDGSAWFISDVFRRVIRVEPTGAVSEFAVGTRSPTIDDLLGVGGRIWAHTQDAHLYRSALPASALPALPIVNQRPRTRPNERSGKVIALLSALLQDSPNALPGTRITVRCLSRCRGGQAAGAVRSSTTRINTHIVLYDRAKVRTTSSLAGHRPTSLLFEFRRAKHHKVRLQILRIDGIPFSDVVGSCGC